MIRDDRQEDAKFILAGRAGSLQQLVRKEASATFLNIELPHMK